MALFSVDKNKHVQRIFSQPIVAVAGGTHLVSADAAALRTIAHTLADWKTLRHISLNHCSGEDAYYTLRHLLGSDVVHPCPAGTVLD